MSENLILTSIWLSGAELLNTLDVFGRHLNQVQTLRDTRSTVNLENIHVEDGPIFPWLRAAQYFQQKDEIDKLSEIIQMIDVELNSRHFHKQDELERLREFLLCNKQNLAKYQSPVHLYCALPELQIHRCHRCREQIGESLDLFNLSNVL